MIKTVLLTDYRCGIGSTIALYPEQEGFDRRSPWTEAATRVLVKSVNTAYITRQVISVNGELCK